MYNPQYVLTIDDYYQILYISSLEYLRFDSRVVGSYWRILGFQIICQGSVMLKYSLLYCILRVTYPYLSQFHVVNLATYFDCKIVFRDL